MAKDGKKDQGEKVENTNLIAQEQANKKEPERKCIPKTEVKEKRQKRCNKPVYQSTCHLMDTCAFSKNVGQDSEKEGFYIKSNLKS